MPRFILTGIAFGGRGEMPLRRLLRVLVLCVLGASLSQCPFQAGAVQSGPLPVVADDYPVQQLRTQFIISEHDLRQCGFFAMWRVDRDKHRPPFQTYLHMLADLGVPDLDGSKRLDDAARQLAIRVDRTPTVGAVGILERGQRGAGSQGHAFYVARVYSGGRMLIEQYNWANDGRYSTAEVPVDWASQYIHF